MTSESSIFIGYTGQNKFLAILLKDILIEAFQKRVSVFAYTIDKGTEGGEDWRDKIIDACKKCKVILPLATPESRFRPWIHFETGLGLGKDAYVIPICAGGLTDAGLPDTLSNRWPALLYTENDIRKLLRKISKNIWLSIQNINKLKELISSLTKKASGHSGWNFVEQALVSHRTEGSPLTIDALLQRAQKRILIGR